MHRVIRYTIDGQTRWAIWSTVIDDFVLVDADRSEVIEYEAHRAARQQRQATSRHIEAILDGRNPYSGWDGPDEHRDRLHELHEATDD